MTVKYLVCYGATTPTEWTAEIQVAAESLREALDFAEPIAQAAGGVITSIEQEPWE